MVFLSSFPLTNTKLTKLTVFTQLIFYNVFVSAHFPQGGLSSCSSPPTSLFPLNKSSNSKTFEL